MQNSYTSAIVNIGNLQIGGHHPIRVQSMTTTQTLDTGATVAQTIRLIEAGCELVRITAQNNHEAEHLKVIKDELKKRGCEVPLIADIHYKPEAAEIAARIVEKVRINPGNYVDRKRGKISYTEQEYADELERIALRIKPLINICKEHGTALRIGSNHGSLSERILLRYGDTPAGMVESAMEFVYICETFGFKSIILSMKASNVKVMVQANRLLVKRMIDLGMKYPIHLGVTEAGDGEDGRIKSAAGIGALLEDGIGDTIRVSLTEEPENEIPVAKALVKKYQSGRERSLQTGIELSNAAFFDPFSYTRRKSTQTGLIGGDRSPVVILSGKRIDHPENNFPKDQYPDYFADQKSHILTPTRSQTIIHPTVIQSVASLEKAAPDSPSLLVFELSDNHSLSDIRNWFRLLAEKKVEIPVILKKSYHNIPASELITKSATDFGFFLVDGLGDGIWLESDAVQPITLSAIAFGILQATGSRITKTEFIACPSCGRTLFNIQDTLQNIKKRTSHLKGLKIGVMGCCVNGPGEMADAHYGYVGAGKGKVTLYKGRKIMKTAIPERDALDALIRLITEHGDWND